MMGVGPSSPPLVGGEAVSRTTCWLRMRSGFIVLRDRNLGVDLEVAYLVFRTNGRRKPILYLFYIHCSQNRVGY